MATAFRKTAALPREIIIPAAPRRAVTIMVVERRISATLAVVVAEELRIRVVVALAVVAAARIAAMAAAITRAFLPMM